MPLYVCGPEDARKNWQAIVYPWRRIPRAAPISSSFDAAMALALMEGFESIHLAGADLQAGTLRERLVEHVSLAYWVGVAGGMGVKVTMPPDARLLKHPWCYGRDYLKERLWAQQACRSALSVPYLDDGAAKKAKGVKGIRWDGKVA